MGKQLMPAGISGPAGHRCRSAGGKTTVKALSEMRLGFKLIGSFIIMAILVAATGIFGIRAIDRVGDRVGDILKTRAGQEKLVLLLEVTQKACRTNLVEGAFVTSEPKEFSTYVESYRKKRDLFRGYCTALLQGDPKLGVPAAPVGSDLAKRVAAIKVSWGEFEQVAEELIRHKSMLLGRVNPGVVNQAAKDALADLRLNELVRSEISEASENAKLDIDDLADLLESQMFRAAKEATVITNTSTVAFFGVIIFAVLLAVVLGILSTRGIMQRIEKMMQAFQRSAEGDLTVRVGVDSGDELGKLSNDFNSMAENLAAMFDKVRTAQHQLNRLSDGIYSIAKKVMGAAEIQADGVSQTSSAVTEIIASVRGVSESVDNLSFSAAGSSSSILEMAASIEEVAQNVETLARSVEDVSASISEMTASIRQIGENVQNLTDVAATTAISVTQMDNSIKSVEQSATEAAAITDEVRRDAETGKKAVDATIAGISAIKRSSRITYEVIETLSTKAENIGAILSVIDEVAEQTNLLALNAAIIAAQAGEHGKGFAVVADEVKDLAERTTSSTREISEVIRGVQDETRRAVEAMGEAERKIADGELLSVKSGEALTKIVSGVNRATAQVTGIARATEEQAQESQLIQKAMDKVSEMVRQISRATQEQGKGSGLIMTAVERMKGLTTQVKGATREQAKVGKFIAQTTEDITGMIRQIKRACDEQNRGGEMILKAIDDMQRSAGLNLDASRMLDDTVDSLARHTGDLQHEMDRFKLEREAA